MKDVVEMLETLMKEAKAGEITGLATVRIMSKDQIGVSTSGILNGALVAGLAYLQTKVIDTMFKGER